MIDLTLAHAKVTDIDGSERWYRSVFGSPPDERPMAGLIEWRFGRSHGVQVFEDPAGAGASTVVVGLTDFDAVINRLGRDGHEHGDVQSGGGGRLVTLIDPDGNQVVLLDDAAAHGDNGNSETGAQRVDHGDVAATAPAATATSLVDDADPADFATAIESLRRANTFVLSTIRSEHRPHAVPLFAVWNDGALHFAAANTTRKAHNLGDNATCVLTTSSDGSDLVVEGTAHTVGDADAVARVAAAYRDKYGWAPEPNGTELCAQGAPTAGTPPYAVHRVDAHTVFAFPNGADHAPTRWTIDPTTTTTPPKEAP